jgi:hypothetical protein
MDAEHAALSGQQGRCCQVLLRQGALPWLHRVQGLPGGVNCAFAERACGKLTASPFGGEATEAMAKEADTTPWQTGSDPRRRAGDRDSETYFRRMSGALELMGDPDFQFLKGVAAHGVPIGGAFILQFLVLGEFGIPMAWRKVKVGFDGYWIGYWIDVASFEVCINLRKRQRGLKWIADSLEDKGVL